MRLVDADAFKRVLFRVFPSRTEVLMVMDLLPTVEQPEIVRCKDCKHYDGNECMIKSGWFPVMPDWFCADGERKDGEQE